MEVKILKVKIMCYCGCEEFSIYKENEILSCGSCGTLIDFSRAECFVNFQENEEK